MKALWGGRFKEQADDFFVLFNRSFPFDYKLFYADVICSKAYAGGLRRAGILDAKEYESLQSALDEMLTKAQQDPQYVAAAVQDGYEDIHAFVESELVKSVGQLGKKLHTGRSRNDQVATDLRYYLRHEIDETINHLSTLQQSLLDLARRHEAAFLPGYTHLQRAQPILWPHYCLSFFEMLQRDVERLQDCRRRVNHLPLGSGALAGNNHDINRNAMAEELGFEGITRNSLDATSDRDFVVEFIHAASLSMMHLSRLSEDLIIYASHEFRFVKMSDKVATGSSLMPQKKNPDALELIRGKSGRIFGHLSGLLATMKGLPSCYNKDMQEDKEPLFDSIEQWQGCLRVMCTVLDSLVVNEEAMAQATAGGYLNATDLADYLVTRGVAFREAHHLVGEIVTYADEHQKALSDLSLEEFQRFQVDIEEDVYAAIDIGKTLAAKKSEGGTAPRRVASALVKAELCLEERGFGKKS